MEKVECPKCIGIGETFQYGSVRKCNLCNGEKKVEEVVYDAFIQDNQFIL